MDPVTRVFQLDHGVDPLHFATRKNITFLRAIPLLGRQTLYEFEVGCADGVSGGHEAVVEIASRAVRNERRDAEVTWASSVQKKRTFEPRGEIPAGQWHLRDDVNERAATHVRDAWTAGVFGHRATVSIVDDGLAWQNADLRPHFSLTLSANLNRGGGSDPTPSSSLYAHGTGAAGVAASAGAGGPPHSEGRSPFCGYGVAPMATLAGVRLISEPVSDSTQALGLSHCAANITVYSCSWGPSDNGRVVDGPDTLTAAALESATQMGRGGLGSIFVWAGGNGGRVGDSCAFDGYASSPDVIAIGAITHAGEVADYSEGCQALFLCAPSSGESGWAITTTSVVPACRTNFGGTSAAAPFVAGVVALIVDAEPRLTGNEIQQILVETARPLHIAQPNAAGLRHEPHCGFGVVDVSAAVARAQQWRGTLGIPQPPHPNRRKITVDPIDASQLSFRGPNTPAVANFRVSPRIIAESVQRVAVAISFQHPARGSVSIALTSPAGTRREERGRGSSVDPGSNLNNWEFWFVSFWGESAEGIWKAEVTSSDTRNSGRVTNIFLLFK